MQLFNDPETEPSFGDFWSSYPRKVARRYAEQCWNRLKIPQKLAAVRELPKHVRVWEAEGRDSSLIPHASTWISQWRFEDELEEPKAVKQAVEKWWISEASIRAKGAELGIYPRGGESWQDFRGRIQSKLQEQSQSSGPGANVLRAVK